jgi:CBS-domain-containing membrane protein
MKAREVMTTAVISVSPETRIGEVAQILRDHKISALPVVDETGIPIGMVSEGDLIGRDEADREARLDWWLTLLAEGETLNADFLASLRAPERCARDVMTAPVVAVGEEAELREVARLLTAHRIKRVPVLRDGRIVGIVSRADLVRALAEAPAEASATATATYGLLAGAVAGIEQRFHRLEHVDRARLAEPLRNPDQTGLMAADFRQLVADHESREMLHLEEQRRTAPQQRRRQLAELIDHHISGESWRSLMHQARQAAERGEKEFMLLRFPNQLCSDGGRAINASAPNWPATLRGEAAGIYFRWEQDLRPNGFRLGARILDFPGGMPGDIGLFLIWSQ